MLARSTERRREIVVRTALGASRGGIIQQLVTESVLLGVVGGALGLLLGYGGLRLIQAVAYEPIFAMLAIDRNVMLLAAAASLLTPVLFSVLPAVHASRADLGTTLREGSGRTIGGARRARSALVVSQVSLALMLVAVAALVVRTLVATTRIDLGFDTRDLLTFRVDAPAWRYADSARLVQFHTRLLDRLVGIAGVEQAAIVSQLPVLGGEATGPVVIEGLTTTRPADRPWSARGVASDHYFETARIPLVAGRAFSSTDDMAAVPVAVVSREMARRYWGGPAAAIGRRVQLGSDSGTAWRTIVGVVGDVKPPDITLPPTPHLYLPLAQVPPRGVAVMLRSANVSTLIPAVRDAMRSVDPELAIYELRTISEALAQEFSSNYVLTGMYAAFAVIALLLAAAGLYGVISYSLSQRTQEIGIRLALGASPGSVRSMVLSEAGRVVGIGIVIGLAGGILIAQAMRSLLYGVTPFDPATYALVVALLGGVMLAALFVPMRRATRIDPARALRSE